MSDDVKRSKRLIRVKKLLALARSNSSSEEAATALRQAQNIMAELKLSEADIDLHSVNEAGSNFCPTNAKSFPEWLVILTDVIENAFGCASYFTWRPTPAGNFKRVVKFYGLDERPGVAAYCFEVLARQLVEASNEYLKSLNKKLKLSTRRARADQFRAGWAMGVRSKVAVLSTSERESTVLRRYELTLGTVVGKIREVRDANGTDTALMKGRDKGLQATLHHGVHGKEHPRIGRNDD